MKFVPIDPIDTLGVGALSANGSHLDDDENIDIDELNCNYEKVTRASEFLTGKGENGGL